MPEHDWETCPYAKKGYIYVAEGGGFHKIGKSEHPPTRRTTEISLVLPFELKVVACLVCPLENLAAAERGIHSVYQHRRIRGEWFRLSAQDLEDLYVLKSPSKAQECRDEAEAQQRVADSV